jgi:hypothetical protein
MVFGLSARTRRVVPFVVAALSVCTLVVARLPALAAPATPAAKSALSASLESSSTAVPLAGSFGYTALVRLSEPASYLQTRLQVRYPTGKLIYQRTTVENSTPAGTLSYSFGRALEGLGLKPGLYPVQLSVTADVAGSTEETLVATDLLVYDVKSAAVPVVLVARVHGTPLADSQGRFVIDPASPEADIPRANVDRVSAFVLEDPGARIVLGVPPVLLAEWKRLSGGYTLADGTVVPADSAVARSYADTLVRLRAAVDTGRLELVSLGYSDPDLTSLVQESLADDLGPQYEAGISACFASLETTPSTGTVPAGDCAPQKSLKYLSAQGVGYVVTSESCVGWGKAKPASGAYPVTKEHITALVTDDKSGKAISRGDTDVALQRAFTRLMIAGKPRQPFVTLIDLGPGRPDATSTVVAAATAFGAEPWARLTLGREVLPPTKAVAVALTEAPARSSAPAGYWKTVRSARAYAGGLLAALGPGGPGVASAQTDSLLAESSAWAEPDGTWASAERGFAFAKASLAVSKAALGNLSIKAEPVTFAGKRGEVPVSITNNSKNTLSVVVRATASGDAEVVGGRTIRTVLRPQETFVPIPVDMNSALSSKLKVEVLAGDIVLAHTTVNVQASYLDRIAIIGGIVLVLGALLIFIVRRVRGAEIVGDTRARTSPGADSPAERYTTDGPDAHRGAGDT